jgi:hypothetical protein
MDFPIFDFASVAGKELFAAEEANFREINPLRACSPRVRCLSKHTIRRNSGRTQAERSPLDLALQKAAPFGAEFTATHGGALLPAPRHVDRPTSSKLRFCFCRCFPGVRGFFPHPAGHGRIIVLAKGANHPMWD